jgi:hypothetical protein
LRAKALLKEAGYDGRTASGDIGCDTGDQALDAPE